MLYTVQKHDNNSMLGLFKDSWQANLKNVKFSLKIQSRIDRIHRIDSRRSDEVTTLFSKTCCSHKHVNIHTNHVNYM